MSALTISDSTSNVKNDQIDIDITDTLPGGKLIEIWQHTFDQLEDYNLPKYTDYKVNVLKTTLDGSENPRLLVYKGTFLTNMEDFKIVWDCVLRISLCCKKFFLLATPVREKLIEAKPDCKPKPQLLTGGIFDSSESDSQED